MGQKVNPVSLRLIKNQEWLSRWFADRHFAQFLKTDILLRRLIEKKIGLSAGVSRVEIERDADKFNLIISTSRPGVLIGRSGQGINLLKQELEKEIFQKTKQRLNLRIEVIGVKYPDLSAALVAQSIGYQISKRIAFRRVARQAVDKVMKAGALGVKVIVAGRLGGAEIARKEKFQEGSIPLATISKNIDYSVFPTLTTYGIIGIKVWIYKKEDSGD